MAVRTLRFIPSAASIAHDELLAALGTENNPAQWMIFMEAVTRLLPAVLSSGRPSRETIERCAIGQLGFKSWKEMIEAPINDGGLGWNISAWKSWRRAWAVIEAHPWLRNEPLTSSEVIQLSLKVKEAANSDVRDSIIPDWFPENMAEAEQFLSARRAENKAQIAQKIEAEAKAAATIDAQITQSAQTIQTQRERIELLEQENSQHMALVREYHSQQEQQALQSLDLQTKIDQLSKQLTALTDQVQGQRQRTLALLLRLRAGRRRTRRQLRKARAVARRLRQMPLWGRILAVFRGYQAGR
ncbi:TPA: hypothetical protein RQN10_004370 [Aeromonas dhakensis]|nr:hypothetical protein [Aeromonas dhakensis]